MMKSGLVIIYFLINFSFIIVNCFINVGPLGQLTIFYIKECDPPIESNVKVSTLLKDMDNHEKAFDFNISLPFDLDENTELVSVIDKWDNGAWQKENLLVQGPFLYYFQTFLPKVWNNFKKSIKPNIEEDNKIKAGDYILENFQEFKESLTIPALIYGRLRITVFIVVDGEEILCRIGEIETGPPVHKFI